MGATTTIETNNDQQIKSRKENDLNFVVGRCFSDEVQTLPQKWVAHPPV
jgi:hypothetical protein